MLLAVLVKTLFILGLVVGVFAPLMTWTERKQSALMQDRIGANRADIGGATFIGLLHPIADVIKLLTKEDVVPDGANRFMHLVAPMLAAVPAIAAFAVIPYGGIYQLGETTISLVVADIDWGVLYIFAIGSLATYGAVLAGWASNSNWSILGAVRNTAQMISYEVTMGLSIVGVFMVFGTLQLTEMASAQDQTLWLFDALPIPNWGIFLQPLGFLMFLTCIMAENKRPPFDLPEADSELVAGYFTEYSGMRFGLFYMAEFIEVVVIAGLLTALFLGGWSVPFLSQETIIHGELPLLALSLSGTFGSDVANLLCMVLHVLTFITKMIAMIWLQMLIRWSLPRFRYDQVMDLCWKRILPLSLFNVFATATVMILLGQVGA
jgi:NADH-quinone oxidoreductase subunit H